MNRFTLYFKKLCGGQSLYIRAMKGRGHGVLISSTIELIDFVPSDF